MLFLAFLIGCGGDPVPANSSTTPATTVQVTPTPTLKAATPAVTTVQAPVVGNGTPVPTTNPVTTTGTNGTANPSAAANQANSASAAPAEAKKPEIVTSATVCPFPAGMRQTTTDDLGRVIATPDALVSGKITVVLCNPKAKIGYSVVSVSGLRPGNKDNNQEGLLVDDGNNVLNINALLEVFSAKPVVPEGKKYSAFCFDLSGDGTGCTAKKPDPPAPVPVVTITIPAGTVVEVKK